MGDPKALDALLKVDGEDQYNYYIGKQAIPKGPEGEPNKYYDQFVAAQRKIGGTDMQLATLQAVRDGKLSGDKTLDSPALDVAHRLLSTSKVDRDGVHFGNLTVTKDAYAEFVHQIEAGNGKLLAQADQAMQGKHAQTMDLGAIQKTENAAGLKLVKGATVDKSGDVHIGHLTVPKADWDKFRDSVLVNTPDGKDRVLRFEKEAADKAHDTHYNPRAEAAASKPLNAEMQAVLKGIPTVGYPSLAELNESRHRMQEHFEAGKLERQNHVGKVELNGVERNGITASGTVTKVVTDQKSGTTTITFDPKGQTLAFPMQQDFDGEKGTSKLSQLATMKPGDSFHLQTDAHNVNGKYDITRASGEFHDYRVGPQSAKLYGEAQEVKAAPAQGVGR